jgi:hypothetical protein
MSLQFNKEMSGRWYRATNYEVVAYDRGSDGYFRGVAIYANVDHFFYSDGLLARQLTGYYTLARSGDIMYQTTSGDWVCLTDGWTQTSWSEIEKADGGMAQWYINKMIQNNAIIYENNLLCGKFSHKLTAEQKKMVVELQKRLMERNDKIKNEGMVTDILESYPPGYAELEPYLNNLKNNVSGVGVVISTTTMIIVGCVVLASVATAAYFAYKSLYNESEEDVKYSKELTETLANKLTPEEYNQLVEETQGIVTRAKIKAKFDNTSDVFKWVLLAVGGIGVWGFIKSLNNKNKGGRS